MSLGEETGKERHRENSHVMLEAETGGAGLGPEVKSTDSKIQVHRRSATLPPVPSSSPNLIPIFSIGFLLRECQPELLDFQP